MSCASQITCSHTFVAHLGCIDIGELLDFLEKCAKWHFMSKLNSTLYGHSEGGANFICMDPKCLLNIFYKV
jgi:hypothetical protein